MDIALTQDEVIPQLWNEYKKTDDFLKNDYTKAIPAHNRIVERREIDGLRTIYYDFLLEPLKNRHNHIESFWGNRSIGEWMTEWKNMHRTLFKWVLTDCGPWRKKDVRFGSPGDEDLHKIPKWQAVPSEMSIFASTLIKDLKQKDLKLEKKIELLAKIHYQFIRIHPFEDGNGRIGRAITDQVSIYLGLPPSIVGYPRHDKKRREKYHAAIKSCATDPSCEELAVWILGYIGKVLQLLA